jgi:hypothetical protein
MAKRVSFFFPPAAGLPPAFAPKAPEKGKEQEGPPLPAVGTLVVSSLGSGHVCRHIKMVPGGEHNVLVEVLYRANNLPQGITQGHNPRPGEM